MAHVLYLDDLEVGQEFTTESRRITAEDVEAFAILTGDLNPVHLDEEAARKSHFGQRVAHGAFIIAVASGLMSKMLIPSTLAAYGLDELRFKHPVYLGDVVHVAVKVTGLKPFSHEAGLVKMRCHVIKQTGERAMVGTFTVITRRRPADH